MQISVSEIARYMAKKVIEVIDNRMDKLEERLDSIEVLLKHLPKSDEEVKHEQTI